MEIELTPPPLAEPERAGLKRLQARHYRIVELCLAGMTNVQIAAEMGMTPVGVGLIVNAPLFQDELARRRRTQSRGIDEASAADLAQVKQTLEQGALKAAQKMVDLVDHFDPKIAQTSAKDILDRTFGGKAQQEQQRAGSVTVLNVDKLQLLMTALQEDKQLQQAVAVADQPSGLIAQLEPPPVA